MFKKLTYAIVIRVKLLVFALILVLCIKIFWFILLVPPLRESNPTLWKKDVFSRRDYLLNQITKSDFGPTYMPSFMSQVMREEWTIGTLSMVSAALTNLAFEYPETRTQAISQIKHMIELMLKPNIRHFEEYWWHEDALDSLDGPNGHIGYLGHLNFMFAIYRILGGGEEYEELHLKVSDALSRRSLHQQSGYLETFPGLIFIPDNMVVMASLSLYDQTHAPRFAQTISHWLEYSKKNMLEKSHGLFVPWLNTEGQAWGPVRGSYGSWNIFYLSFIDREFALDQYKKLSALYAEIPLGAAALREYDWGTSGSADVDSGPIIFGLSTSGTGFMMAGASLFGDYVRLNQLLRTAEFVGSTVNHGTGRRYLLAPLIGDAIVLAMRTARAWDLRYQKHLTDSSHL